MDAQLELYMEALNAILGLVLMLISYGIYGLFRKTSLASPLRIIGWSIFIFVFHEALDVVGHAWGWDENIVSTYYGFAEVVFGLLMLIGFYEFKKQFEKFEWVREISTTSEIIGGK